mgnify:CR=1 FL=1
MSKHKSKKVRRDSGRVVPMSTLKIPKKIIINNCLEPQEYWDDWTDYRDGMRSCGRDKTKLKKAKKKSIMIKKVFHRT